MAFWLDEKVAVRMEILLNDIPYKKARFIKELLLGEFPSEIRDVNIKLQKSTRLFKFHKRIEELPEASKEDIEKYIEANGKEKSDQEEKL